MDNPMYSRHGEILRGAMYLYPHSHIPCPQMHLQQQPRLHSYHRNSQTSFPYHDAGCPHARRHSLQGTDFPIYGTLDYHRSSSSSSTSSGSGHQLVRSSHNSPLFQQFSPPSLTVTEGLRKNKRPPRHSSNHGTPTQSPARSLKRHLELPSPPKFTIGTSSESSLNSYSKPKLNRSQSLDSSTSHSSGADALKWNSRTTCLSQEHSQPYTLPNIQGLSPVSSTKILGPSLYDHSWQTSRGNIWCPHSGKIVTDKKCSECQQLKEETESRCSSVNPPPTFTALDNYQTLIQTPLCSCGKVFAATVIFSALMLGLIAAFIIYVEVVLKYQTANVMERM